jgi:uncharacterized protein
MSQQTLRHVFQDVFASGLVRQILKVAWHAGEPLVLPSSYYTAAFDIIEHLRPSDVAVDHCMQTNGTLIDDAWCEYITHHGIKIGVSIDGPARLHDARRRTRAGAGTHARVMRGIRHLQDHGIQFDVITVLTREALSSPEELFEFYMAAGIKRVGFNIEEIEGCNERSSLNVAEAEAEFRQFLERFWDLVERSGNALRVREFDRILEMIKAPPGTGVENIQVEPFRVLSFDRAGNWSSFSPELLGFPNSQYDNFRFGSVGGGVGNAAPLGSLESAVFKRVSDEIQAGVEACAASCPYFAICGGGAPANKLFENGSFNSTETLFCRLSVKVLFDVVADRIEATLSSAKSGE